MTRFLVLLAALGTAAPTGPPSADPDTPEPRVVEVRMVDKSPTEFAFEPARVTVRPGDIVRFVQRGVMPHNVEFKGGFDDAPPGEVPMSPYLTQPNQTWDLVVDHRFEPGEHPFVCTPHQFLGMRGVLVVEP